MKKKPKVRQNAHKRSKTRRPNPAFPFTINPFGDDLGMLTSAAGNVAILASVQGCTINEKIIIGGIISSVLLPVLRGCSEKGKTSLADKILNCQMSASDCVCKGECLCHTGMQIAGVPCPPDCPNVGKHLDGCHRCDCADSANGTSQQTAGDVEKSANTKATEDHGR